MHPNNSGSEKFEIFPEKQNILFPLIAFTFPPLNFPILQEQYQINCLKKYLLACYLVNIEIHLKSKN